MSAQGKSQQTNLPASPWLGLRPDTVGPLDAQLEAANTRYKEGAYAAAVEILHALFTAADQLDAGGSDAARTRLLASARALEARALVRLGQDASEAGRLAAAAFGKSMMSRGTDPLTADERRDLGIMLYLSGQDGPARDQLDLAIQAGAADAEVYRFRGLALMRLESFADATDALTTSLQIEAGHLPTLEALVTCVDRPTTSADVKAKAYFDLAEAYYVARRFDDALKACSRSAELENNARAQTALGVILTAQDEFDRAIAAFDNALTFDPHDSFVLFRKGEALRLLGRLDEALTLFRHIPESATEHLLALGSSGDILRRQGHTDEALKTLDLALELSPQYAFGLSAKADVLYGLDRNDEALELYQRALAIDPQLTWAAFRAADLLRMHSRFDESLTLITPVLERAPNSVEALGTKGAALIGLGRRDEGIDVLDQALAKQPDYMFGLVQKALALLDLDRQADAIPILRHILALAPSTGLHRQQLIDALRATGEHEAALVEVDQVLKDLPNDPWYLGTKGQVLHNLGKDDEAVVLLERAVELDPKLMWAYGSLGDVLFTLRRYDDALKALDRALELSPTDTFAMATKGQVLAAQEKRPEGIALLSEAVRLERERVRRNPTAFKLTWALFDLAENLRVTDRLPEAIDAYDELLKYQPQLANALGGRGSTLFAQERYQEALASLDRAIEIAPKYAFGLAVKGALLASCGELEAAIDPLARAAAADPSMSYACFVKGFTQRVLGQYREAEEALLRARELAPDDPQTEQNLADVYRATGETEKGNAIFQAIIARATGDLDPDTASLVGWCYYRLGKYDRAVQSLAESVSRGRLMAHAQFDLALALLCSDRAGLAATEYERGIEMATTEHQPWRRRGLYRLALHDLNIARGENPQAFANPQAATIAQRLQAEYDRSPKLTAEPAAATAMP